MSLRQIPRLGLSAAIFAMAGSSAMAGGWEHRYSDGLATGSAPWIVTYSGTDISKDSHYFYQGVLVALNRDIGRDGFVLRAYGSYLSYEYDNAAVPGGVTDGDGWQGDILLGYQATRGPLFGAVYVGVDHQRYDLTPDDPTNKIRGSETGFKVAGNVETTSSVPFFVGLAGEYTTAFDSYWARGRLGVRLGKVTIGPEAHILGDESYDGHRVGGFMTMDVKLTPGTSTHISIAAGQQTIDSTSGPSSRGGGDGAYGSIGFAWTF